MPYFASRLLRIASLSINIHINSTRVPSCFYFSTIETTVRSTDRPTAPRAHNRARHRRLARRRSASLTHRLARYTTARRARTIARQARSRVARFQSRLAAASNASRRTLAPSSLRAFSSTIRANDPYRGDATGMGRCIMANSALTPSAKRRKLHLA